MNVLKLYFILEKNDYYDNFILFLQNKRGTIH